MGRAVWVNELGGLTVAFEGPSGREFVKWAPHHDWVDLAVATYPLGWNYSGWWEHELLAAYGIERDEERIQYYRRLWDAT